MRKNSEAGFREGRGKRIPANRHERKQMPRCLGKTQQQTRLDDKGRVHLKKEKATQKVLSRPSGGIEEHRRGPRITSCNELFGNEIRTSCWRKRLELFSLNVRTSRGYVEVKEKRQRWRSE